MKKEIKVRLSEKDKKMAISLFSSSGIGNLALEYANINVILANELIKARAELFKNNFPNCKMLQGDIWELKKAIIDLTRLLLNGRELDVVFATPPCQGMSKNGRGKLLNSIREGKKPKLDIRNRLIIPTMQIIKELKPKIVVLENVPEMQNTSIEIHGKIINIMDFIKQELGSEYVGKAEVVQFADYGVPQRRKRLITVFTKETHGKKVYKNLQTFMPPKTHTSKPNLNLPRWITVRDIIHNTPILDSSTKERSVCDSILYHKVPVLDQRKYFWVSNTPSEQGAFDNQCVNYKCGFQGNPKHKSKKEINGINQSSKETPIHCIKCGSLLPRPTTKTPSGNLRLMKAFSSAYRRMKWDLPANTLTTNLSYACSDNKLHPEQHRVLSLHEAMLLHTLNEFNYEWKRADLKPVSDKLVRESIGESIPPKGLSIIFIHIMKKLLFSGV